MRDLPPWNLIASAEQSGPPALYLAKQETAPSAADPARPSLPQAPPKPTATVSADTTENTEEIQASADVKGAKLSAALKCHALFRQ